MISDERKNRIKEISNYNYDTAKKLLDAINDDKNKKMEEKNLKNCIFHKVKYSILYIIIISTLLLLNIITINFDILSIENILCAYTIDNIIY